MPYVFWIDHAKARLKLVELVFIDVDWTSLYTLGDFEDFIFRYEDLSPWAVVLDEAQFPFSSNELVEYFNQKKIRIIHLADQGEVLKFQELSLGVISRVLNPMQLRGKLYEFYIKARASSNH